MKIHETYSHSFDIVRTRNSLVLSIISSSISSVFLNELNNLFSNFNAVLYALFSSQLYPSCRNHSTILKDDVQIYLDGAVSNHITSCITVPRALFNEEPEIRCFYEYADDQLLFDMNHGIKIDDIK